MNRRGDVHVDWIISMGIFLISTIALFLFFRPTDVPPVSGEVLLDTINYHFNDNFTWVVKTTPVFVSACRGYTADGVDETMTITIDTGNDWEVGYVDYYREEDPANPEEGHWPSFGNIECPGVEDIVQKQFHIVNDPPAEFIFTTYPTIFPPSKAVLSVSCSPDSVPNELLEDYCDFSVGSVENFEGINTESDAFVDFKNYKQLGEDHYFSLNQIKENWDFPERNEFWILACNSGVACDLFGEDPDDNTYLINYKTGSPHPQADVLTREVKTFIIGSDGVKMPVSIYFRVW